jgi:hypothetical protein
MHRYNYLLMIFIILFFSAFAKKNNTEISQKWIQIQTNEDGSTSYYNKQLINENGSYKEVELDYHTFVSSLNLLSDSSYENTYLNFDILTETTACLLTGVENGGQIKRKTPHFYLFKQP